MKKLETEDTKTKIINDALTLFEKKGFAASSINEILELSGLTKGSFYHYFNSKDDLLFQIHYSYIEEEVKRTEEIYYNDILTNKEKLILMATSLFSGLVNYKKSFSVFFQEFKYINSEKFKEVLKLREKLGNYYIKVIDDGKITGEFRSDTHSRIITYGIMGIVAWGVQWHRTDGPLTIEEITDIYLAMLLNGIEN